MFASYSPHTVRRRSAGQNFRDNTSYTVSPSTAPWPLSGWAATLEAMGLIPCHMPRRSPQSNGLAEAFFGSFKRDYVYQARLETLFGRGAAQVPAWIDHYNREVPHSALRRQSPAECYAAWLGKNKT